ncbi:hypothetical protein PILCRDRAFT_121422 [Piloderma croceum F 1598]|uniref:Nephrocystin 3-like N-terminal domain-containing protein n=1 Tax=Piloderma croceum (strain F 1598) TaxID=765440 RepID=A0A0C3CRS6_PILCF|nr:hypothetical protein PILCRDRAFT_121422 [Piloderma croceum F 1598]
MDFHAPNILWIKGSPGSGKSTIASSLVSRLMKSGRLCSHFAFKRGDIMLNDPATVWRTVAHDLSRYDDAYPSILVTVLKSGRVDLGAARYLPFQRFDYGTIIQPPRSFPIFGALHSHLRI